MNKQELIDAVVASTGDTKAATGAAIDAILAISHARGHRRRYGSTGRFRVVFDGAARRTHWTQSVDGRRNPDCRGKDGQVHGRQGIQGCRQRAMTKVVIAPGDYAGLHEEVVSVVESARRTAARNVNAVMTAAYWEIGRRIVASEQGGQARAGYGQALIARLADDLTRRFGRGFGRANLASMRAFYSAWPAAEIFQTVSGKSAAPENVQTPVWKIAAGARRCRRHGNGARLHGASHPFYVAVVGLCAPAFSEDGGRSQLSMKPRLARRLVGASARPPDQ